ncbi:twin-arginine translocase TatA/TatE family subunit [Paenibacillus anseongense]|uniref:twin-arginine translocase TatA/TatE family subunit n=1 Tax=Paenibacillus anseongense TaxID=2682845 RepID=UPI002DBFDAE3|nr:twin-arginine translocase TatA/TatE family subunit [Paenibacillus anseongense]MEC0264303.1 twin-arginine translocase TatA/TatE family subunit [Paenibacillus anseongense]
MFQNIGFTELLLIAVVALVLFGPNKLPEIGRVLGRTLRDFKKGAYELMNDEPKAAPPAPAAVQPAPEASPAAEEQAPAAVVAFASGPALDKADASPASPAPAAVAFATSAPALDKAVALPSVQAAPAAVQPAEKAAVAFISSAPGPELTDLVEDSDAPRATSTPAAPATPAAVQPSHPRRLPD